VPATDPGVGGELGLVGLRGVAVHLLVFALVYSQVLGPSEAGVHAAFSGPDIGGDRCSLLELSDQQRPHISERSDCAVHGWWRG